MVARLVILPGQPEAGQTHRLAEYPLVTIGRAVGNQIVLTDEAASTWHLRLENHSDGWWVKDLNSTNGTRVNGSDVRNTQLKHADAIQIGRCILRIHDDGTSAASRE